MKGCLLGVLAGDRFGSRAEGLTPAVIRDRHGSPEALAAIRPGRYGAATEMTVAVAESLVRVPEFDGGDMARSLSATAERGRGYGPGTWSAIERLREGAPWREAAIGRAGRSSFGNGAATRAAPVGLLYGFDVEALRWVAEEVAAVTHQHALGAEGAALQAVAVALAAGSAGRSLSPAGFLLSIGREASLREYRVRYEEAARMTERTVDQRRVIDKLGNGETALGSVVTAAYCFACEPTSFVGAIAAATALGGSAAALVSMTGAISGAYLGAAGVPANWLEGDEEVDVVRERLEAAAVSLVGAASRLG